MCDRNDTEVMQGRLLDLENHLKDETSEKKRLERELKQKDRDNQTALTEVGHQGIEVGDVRRGADESLVLAGEQVVVYAGTIEGSQVGVDERDFE